ncbi:MAG: leucine-rich repeat protein [Clostridiales bacterium]|nr:leucine-rich repeat protein [Clostridiales bacterium]
MKKIVAILMQIILFVSVFSFPVNAVTAEWDYTIQNGFAVINAYDGNEEYVIIPSEFEGYPVRQVGAGSFAGNTTIKSVMIPESVYDIGEKAFEGCVSLSLINLPITLKHVGRKAFFNTEYYNSESNWTIRDIDTGASVPWEFLQASELETLYLGNVLINAYINGTYTVKTGTLIIADNAFEGSSELKNVKIPDTVTYVGYDAFKGCVSLGEIVFMNEKTAIESGALFDTAIYKNNKNWQDGALIIKNTVVDADADKREVDIPDGIEIIRGRHIFKSSVLLPESVSYIDEEAFSGDNTRALITGYSYAKEYCIENGISIVDTSTLASGDLNFDGEFNSTDYSICKAVAFSSQNPGKIENRIGDLDCDGFIDSFDAIAIELIIRGELSTMAGDTDGDKTVTEEDYERILDIIYGKAEINDQFTFDRCDLNNDGSVDGFDAIYLNLILNKGG